MTWTKPKTMTLTITVIIVLVGAIVLLTGNPGARDKKLQQAKIAGSIDRINQANVGLPDPQVQAKTLIFAAMIQKKIPAVANWCDTLNAGNKL